MDGDIQPMIDAFEDKVFDQMADQITKWIEPKLGGLGDVIFGQTAAEQQATLSARGLAMSLDTASVAAQNFAASAAMGGGGGGGNPLSFLMGGGGPSLDGMPYVGTDVLTTSMPYSAMSSTMRPWIRPACMSSSTVLIRSSGAVATIALTLPSRANSSDSCTSSRVPTTAAESCAARDAERSNRRILADRRQRRGHEGTMT
jgi:hypothetical protein